MRPERCWSGRYLGLRFVNTLVIHDSILPNVNVTLNNVLYAGTHSSHKAGVRHAERIKYILLYKIFPRPGSKNFWQIRHDAVVHVTV